MIIVTGGAGFIGSNLVKALNQRGVQDILVVDDLQNGHQFSNLSDLDIVDYMDASEFLDAIELNHAFFGQPRAIFHQGACSTTTEWNGQYMMENNFTYSKMLLNYTQQQSIPLMYASSAAVYGGSDTFKEARESEKALNVYGYSKWQFDQYVRYMTPKLTSQVVGLRYFNVYGPREAHKGSMASVAYHLNNQFLESGVVKLFAGSGGYADGEQRRDFVFVDDVVDVNLWFLDHPNCSGIFNVGTGRSQTFNDVAQAVLAWHGRGKLEYIRFPEHLEGVYQHFTEADISALRGVGYDHAFKTVEEGVKAYLDWLNQAR